MTYQAPYSSSPAPSTPDRSSRNNIFRASNPSTTPAGPPPSSTNSFTPAGNPPQSILGSSFMGATDPVRPLSFAPQNTFNPSPDKFNFNSSGFGESTTFNTAPERSNYGAPKQRNFHNSSYGDEEDEYEQDAEGEDYMEEDEYRRSSREAYDEEEMEEEMEEDDAPYDDDEDMDDYQSGARSNGLARSTSDLLLGTPGAGTLMRTTEHDEDLPDLQDPFSSTLKPSVFGKIAKDMCARMGLPDIEESDDLILETEAIITNLYEEGVEASDDVDALQETLRQVSSDLTSLWADYQSRNATYNSEEYTSTIGPGPGASNFERANFLAGLALSLHHPEPIAQSGMQLMSPKAVTTNTIPRVLVAWLAKYHDPYSTQFDEIKVYRPSPANHPLFWGAMYNGILHGKIASVVDTLKAAGWRHARSGADDMTDFSSQAGFTGQSLVNIEKVSNAAVQVLSTCPAIKGDWNIRGSDWTLFRVRVSQAIEDLKDFAEGRDRGNKDSVASNKMGKSSMGTYSTIARKAESQVPWNIYQNFLTLYSLVLGDSEAVIANAQDWCEATIGLVLWWDGGKDTSKIPLGQSRASYRRSSTKVSDKEAYTRRMREALKIVTDDKTDLEVNTLNPIEVGLAALLDGDNEAVLGFLRAWSGPVSSAVAEVASIGEWLPPAESQNLITMGSLDQEDMELLGIASSPSKTDSVKDTTLIAYALALANKGTLEASSSSKNVQQSREGWELAIAVLGRLDNAARSEEIVGNCLKDFELDSAETVDKLWILLTDIGMTRHAETVAESYANLLAEDSEPKNYGEAIWYYAMAHKEEKVKDVLNLLISYSLIQSIAFPPQSDMDEYLKRLVSNPKDALHDLSSMDVPAAELLHKSLSGYATLRRFYDLRDEEVLLQPGQRASKGPIARKAEAANALLAVITSSDDNIRGGLYDEERGAVVSVDFLLALLGEAMVFVCQPSTTLNTSQIDILLKAIEDLQTVGPRIYSICTDFLDLVIASAQGLKGSTPHDLLRKSTSNASGTSSFSMVGSSMLASQLKQSMSGSSGVLVKGNVKRGWDWRRGISAGTTGDDVLRILRLGLAKDLAKAWLLEADGQL